LFSAWRDASLLSVDYRGHVGDAALSTPALAAGVGGGCLHADVFRRQHLVHAPDADFADRLDAGIRRPAQRWRRSRLDRFAPGGARGPLDARHERDPVSAAVDEPGLYRRA